MAVIAGACLAIALLDGGYGEQARAATAVLVWSAFMIGAIGRLREPVAVSRPALIAGGALLGLGVFTLLSSGWASDDGSVFTETVRVAAYLGLFALVVITSRPGGRIWLSGLTLGLTAVALFALGSRLVPSLFPDQSDLGLLAATSPRLSYPVNYWNGLGAVLALTVVLLAHFGAEAQARATRALAVSAIPIAGLALFLTASRGGFGALAAGLLALAAVGPRRVPLVGGIALAGAATVALALFADGRQAFMDGDVDASTSGEERVEMIVATALMVMLTAAVRFVADRWVMPLRVPRTAGIVAWVGVAVVVLGALVAGLPQDRWSEFKEPLPDRPVQVETGFVVSHLGSGGGSGRYQLWENAWTAFEAEPLRGIGAGAFEQWWTETGPRYQPVRDAHSLYMETLAQLGIVGALLLLAFLLVPLAAGLRMGSRLSAAGRAAGAIVVAGMVSASVDWTWELPAAFAPVIVALGILSVEASKSREARGATAARLGVAMTLGIACMGIGLVSYVAEDHLSDSREAFRAGNLEHAVDEARGARSATPWAAAPRLQLALLEERRDLAAALGHVEQAISRAPDDWRIWLVAARLRTRAGDVDGARQALATARRLNPRAEFLPR
ncbi:MAG TPA: O-antigen ligase family protein [Thermoleophilaceae bacterium]|nr:O-antigen ligase family protein [Thermoleophilaceae bacterium]